MAGHSSVGVVAGFLFDEGVFAENPGYFFESLAVGVSSAQHLAHDSALLYGDGGLDVLDGVGELLAVETADA
jgi:hypothetical protein